MDISLLINFNLIVNSFNKIDMYIMNMSYVTEFKITYL